MVENDYDEDGRALLDEFWDTVHAYIHYAGPIRFEVSVERLDQHFIEGDVVTICPPT